ncbi:MAG: hypothetical protein RR672_04035 [Raoultibacter sp.]
MDSTILASKFALWFARCALFFVFIVNVQCAIQFVIWPDAFVSSYELSGIPGSIAIQGLGVAFLMWNTTYPIAIAHPEKFRVVYGIVLAQQVIGLVGETAILVGMPSGHEILTSSILRFIA